MCTGGEQETLIVCGGNEPQLAWVVSCHEIVLDALCDRLKVAPDRMFIVLVASSPRDVGERTLNLVEHGARVELIRIAQPLRPRERLVYRSCARHEQKGDLLRIPHVHRAVQQALDCF